MRIAYVTQAYPPSVSGASVFARQMAEGMAQRGHHVLVIAPSGRGNPYRVLDGNLRIVRLQSCHNPLRTNQRYMLFPHRGMMQALREFQPEILHSHDTLLVGLFGLEYARRARIPSVTTTHQLPSFVTNSLPLFHGIQAEIELTLWLYGRWLFRQYTAVIAQTQSTSERITRMTRVPTRTISCGTNLSAFHPPHHPDDGLAARTRLGLPPHAPIILHVGQLHIGKQVNRVIETSARAMQETQAHLLVVGDGPAKSALIGLCNSLGIANRVHFPGFITVEQGLPDVYRLATLFVTAAEIETQGIVLLEAAASGLPIVAVRATCIPEIVHHGENGFLTEPGDLPALARSITTLLQDSELATRMGKESHKLAQVHDQQNTMKLHEELYGDLIARVPGTIRKPGFFDPQGGALWETWFMDHFDSS